MGKKEPEGGEETNFNVTVGVLTVTKRTNGSILRGANPNISAPQGFTLDLLEEGVGLLASVPFFVVG